MAISTLSLLPLSLTLLAAIFTPPNQDPGDWNINPGAQKSQEQVQAWVKSLSKEKSAQAPLKIEAIEDEALHKVFPHDDFLFVRYMRYPRAVRPPEPLKLENLVQVDSEQHISVIASQEALIELITMKLVDVKTEEQARDLLLSTIRLAEEFYQDGYYTFEIPKQSESVVVRDGEIVASGKARVIKGGTGEVSVKLTTSPSAKVTIEGKVRANARMR